MGRYRQYAVNADRQAAYRRRLKEERERLAQEVTALRAQSSSVVKPPEQQQPRAERKRNRAPGLP